MITGETETPADMRLPTPDDALASSFNWKGTPPMMTSRLSVRLTEFDSGKTAADIDTDHFFRASIRLRKPSTAFSTEDGSSSARDASK